jgi:hypothetical protein
MLSVLGISSMDAVVNKSGNDEKGNTSYTPVDLLQTNIGLDKLNDGFTASDLNKTIQKYFDKLPGNIRPTWLVRFLICSVSLRVMIGMSQFIDLSI